MKKFLTLGIIVGLLLVINPVLASPRITLQDYDLSETVSPGDDFGLTIVLDNTERKIAEDIEVQIKTSYPVSLEGTNKKHLDELRKWNKKEVTFPLKIEEGANEGNYPVQFIINYQDSENNQYTGNYVVNIPVKGRKKLALYLSQSSKTDIYSDDSATLEFEVLNRGSVNIDSLVAEASGESPLDVKWSSKESVLGKLSAQDSKKFEVKVDVNKTAKTGKYPIKIDLTGKNFNFEQSFQIPVKGKPNFEVVKVQPKSIKPDSEDKPVEVFLKNTGGAMAEEIEGKLLIRYPFSTKATTKFLQSIEKKRNDSMVFSVDTDEEAQPGNYSVDLSLEYEAQGEDFSETVKVPVQVEKGNSLLAKYWWAVVIALIVLGAIYLVRERTDLIPNISK